MGEIMDFDAKMKAYNERLEKEYNGIDLDQTDSIEMGQKVRKDLVPWVPTFIAGIIDLARNAKSESVRLKACSYGLETIYGKGVIADVEDGINKLVNSLTNPVGQSPHED